MSSVLDRVHLPLVRDALQRVRPAIFEHDPRTGDEVLHGPGDEDLARPRQGSDAGTYMHADAPHVTASELHLARVNAGADLDVESCDAVSDGSGRLRASRRAIDGCG